MSAIQRLTYSIAITINQKLSGADSDDPLRQFKHQLSLASSSRSEKQKIEGLTYLANKISSDSVCSNLPTSQILGKVLPLVCDSSHRVRTHLLRLLQTFPPSDAKRHVERIILYVRVGMTSLSSDVNEDSMSVLGWILEVAPDEVVSSPGGWAKPISCFLSVLRWSSYMEQPTTKTSKWTTAPRASLGSVAQKQAYSKHLVAFGKFLAAGLSETKEDGEEISPQDKLWQSMYVCSKQSNAFAHLNIFGTPRDEDGRMYVDRNARKRLFVGKYLKAVTRGLEEAKKEGGIVGRAATSMERRLTDCLG